MKSHIWYLDPSSDFSVVVCFFRLRLHSHAGRSAETMAGHLAWKRRFFTVSESILENILHLLPNPTDLTHAFITVGSETARVSACLSRINQIFTDAISSTLHIISTPLTMICMSLGADECKTFTRNRTFRFFNPEASKFVLMWSFIKVTNALVIYFMVKWYLRH